MRKISIFAVATIIASSTSAFAQAQYAPPTCAYGYYENADEQVSSISTFEPISRLTRIKY